MADVTSEFLTEGIDPDELASVVMFYYGRGTQSSPEIFDYSRDDTSFALRLVYDDVRLVQILTGQNFSEHDRASLKLRIASELLSSTQPHIKRQIFFSRAPVKSFFRAHPHFQIIPVPPDAPKPPFNMSILVRHPFIVEFAVRPSPNPIINTNRSARLASNLMVLLNAVFDNPIYAISNTYRAFWVRFENEEKLDTVSKLGLEAYGFESFTLTGDEFSTTAHLQPMHSVERSVYYNRFFDLSRPMQAPDNLDHLIQRFYSLPTSDKEKFLIAAFWLHQATVTENNSVKFLSLIYAIDTLVPNESGGEPCRECNRPKRTSETDKFLQFLNRIVPEQSEDTNQVRAARRKLLRLRGDLAHGRDLLASDRDARKWAFNAEGAREESILEGTSLLAKRAIVNWLSG